MDMMVIVVAVLGFVVVAGLGFAFAGSPGSEAKAVKRAQAMATASPARGDSRIRAATTAEARRKQILKGLKDEDQRQKKARLSLDNKILQAGLSIKPAQFWIFSAVLGVVIFLAGLLILPRPGGIPFLAVAAGLSGAFGLPLWALGFLGKRRIAKFSEVFSDAMDIIVRGIKSGLPVHDCLKIISRETPEPLAGEFGNLVDNIGMGLSLDQSLDKLYERMPTAELRFFSIVMNVQQKTGGNLAEALNNLSVVLRSRKLMREKIKALSSEAIASAAIIGVLPPGVVVLIYITTPSYMQPMFTDPRGQMMLMGGALWMAAGIWVMRRMINFKF